MSGTLTAFTAGDLVISVVGDVDNTGTLTLDQASPIYLDELTTSGSLVGQMILPQTTTVVNGVTEYGISGEYGSASEGSLQLSGDGQSLVILGYGVNANAFNTGTVYGTSALGQTTSIPGGTITPVPRIVADISYNGTIDTSTALYNIYNTNNPRSVDTINGTTFYLSGQGVKGDTTQGVFYAHDGATGATAIDTSTDTRFVTIYNGQLYVSRDSTSSANGTNIANYGSTLPTGKTTPAVLPGISQSIVLTAAQENTVNAGAVGTAVNLSPENFFFASPTVLYVADAGVPKNGGIGDGGLQKWVFNGSSWVLEYTLSAGLNLVNSTTATSGTSGLIGLTGTVIGGVAQLYATNETVGELDQSYLFGITDTLSATSAGGESFTLLDTAAPDTIIRGISFAPTEATTTVSATSVTSGVTSTGIVVTSGSSLTVANGGTAVSATILAGGTATISSGGVDSGTDIGQGGTETVLGTTSGDFVGGIQLVSAATAVVTNDIVLNGGTVELFLKGGIASGATVDAGGALLISGNATATNAVLSGGLIELQSPKAILGGTLTFVGGGTIEVTSNTSPISAGVTFGDLAVLSGFGSGDVIDFTANTSVGAAGTLATIGTTVSGGNIYATVSGGGATETYIFAGTVIASELALKADGNGGEEIYFNPPPPVVTTISSGVSSSNLVITSGSFLDILSGGTAIAATIQQGGNATVEIGGIDSGSTIASGGMETVFGTVSGDAVSGTQLLSAPTSAASSIAVANNEIVYNGGAVDLFLKGAIANNITVTSGGIIAINGNAVASNTVLLPGGVAQLQSPKASFGGSLTFSGGGTLSLTGVSSAGYGELAVISGFGSGAAVDYTLFGAGASLSSTVSGGNTVTTITSGGASQTAIFAGSVGSNLILTSDGNGGEEIVYTGSGSSSGGSGTSSSTITVTSGMTQSNLVVSGGTILSVLSGGTIIAADVLSGGSATVQSGGVDSATTIAAGGFETMIGSATGDLILGTQFDSGAVTSDTISLGGSATVEGGATDSGSVILAGGNELVFGSANLDQVSGIQLISAGTAVVSNESVFNGGSIELFLKGAIANSTTVNAGGSLLISGNATASNTVIDNGGTIQLQSPKAVLSGSVTFDGAGTIDYTAIGSAGYGDLAVISGFGTGDVIEFTSVGSGATLSTSFSGGVTTATVSSGGVTQSLLFDGANPAISLVNVGGVTEIIPCFAAGTRIETIRGEVAIEALKVGDLVPTVVGGTATPIVWIGRREADCGRHPNPSAVWPVRIAAGAFGPGRPHTDLFLSPDHSVYVNDVLIPVKHLINGDTIQQVAVDHVTYYHIELAQHDVVLAQGLPAESFLDMKDGAHYRDDVGVAALSPDRTARLWEAYGCAPLVLTGPELAAVRALLRQFSGARAAA